jgi:hypothetical protein
MADRRVITRSLLFSVLIADEISRIKNRAAKHTIAMLRLNQTAERCWGLTHTAECATDRRMGAQSALHVG